MHCLRALLAFSHLILAVVGIAAERTPPPHPTVLLAEYQGQRYQVIAAEKDKPVIEVDGKRLSLPDDTPLSTERAPSYSGLSARIENFKMSRPENIYMGNSMPGGRKEFGGLRLKFRMDIVPTQDLHDCFVALIHFEEEFILDDVAREEARKDRMEVRDRPVSPPQIRVRQIADLKANQSLSVALESTYLRTGRIYVNMDVAAIDNSGPLSISPLFSQGREVKTNQPEHTARYFYHREKLVHAAVAKNWLKQNQGLSQPLRPVLQIPPLFDSTEGFPTDATATLSVGPDGTVAEATLDREFPPDAAAILDQTLHAWLFLPKLQDGTPVGARVKVPLRF